MKGKLGYRLRVQTAAILCVLAIGSSAGLIRVSAHGGEDHGDEKPKTETTAKGSVLRTTRLGDFEVTVKHPPLEPDTIAHGNLFVTRYATNEPVDAGSVQVTLEAQNGTTLDVAVTKSATAGSYALDVPAVAEGEYTLRVTITAGGKASTASFSGVEARHESAAIGTASSWSGLMLTAMFLVIGIGLFGALVYLSVRVAGRRRLNEETVSA